MKQALQGEGGFDERPRSDPDAGCHRSLERAVSASAVFQTVPREVATHSPPQMAAPQARGRLLDSPGNQVSAGSGLVVAWGTGVRGARIGGSAAFSLSGSQALWGNACESRAFWSCCLPGNTRSDLSG